MRIVLVTGIYPPDIGGPATHTADLRSELLARGHRVSVLTLGEGGRIERAEGVVRIPRGWAWPIRHAAVAEWLWDRREHYDVVYATGMHPSAVAGAELARRPVIVKIVGDAAWERGRRRGLTDAGFEPFQTERGGPLSLRAMRVVQNWTLRRATAVTAPSPSLARTIDGWLSGPADVEVIPNGVRSSEPAPDEGGREDSGLQLIFVGRLVAHKRVDRIVEAVAETHGTSLEIVGDGPERAAIERAVDDLDVRARVRFQGELPHGEVLHRIARADALVLASDYEGLPHVVIEAVACGTPVISPPVGGVEEVVTHGESGLIVAPVTPSLAEAFARLADDPELLEKLSAGAVREGEGWRIGSTVDRIERLADRVLDPVPTVAFLGRTRAPGTVTSEFAAKLKVLQRYTRPTLVNTGRGALRHAGRTRLVLTPDLPIVGGPLLYALGSAAALGITAGRRRSAIVCQSPYEGVGAVGLSRLLPRSVRPGVIVEVHGDWRTATRLYGSDARKVLAPLADRAAMWSLRRADAIRVVSRSMRSLVEQVGATAPVHEFPTFSDLSAFLAAPPAPLPESPVAAFVGVLEGPKGIDVLLDAWGDVARQLPDARLVIAGDGRLRDELERRIRDERLGGSVMMLGRVPHDRVQQVLDGASLLVVPSRSEGLPRVVSEAMARGRAVIGTEAGGIPELVVGGETGEIVPIDDPAALGEALAALLGNARRLASMGAAARARVEQLEPAGGFEDGIQHMAAWVIER